MTFTEAIRTCFQKYATFSGRARRSEFWWFVLLNTQAVLLSMKHIQTNSERLRVLSCLVQMNQHLN